MTAPAPRSKKLGSITFARNAYGNPDLFGPNGGLSLEDYEDVLIDVQGVLTIAGGTVSGTPGFFNPRSILKSLECKITGSPLSDSFVEIPVTELVAFNIIEAQRGVPGSGLPKEVPVLSGDAGTYNFRIVLRLPFCADDMPNPYKYFFPMNRYGQVTFRIRWGTEEDLVAGGDRTKTISATTATFFGRSYSGNPDFDLATGLLFHQRNVVKQASISALGVDQDLELTRTPSFLRGVLVYQFKIDSNGVETPDDTIIVPTGKITLRLNDADNKWDQWTWEMFEEENRKVYGALPRGMIFMDNSPRGDEELLKSMFMTNFSKMTVRYDNANTTGQIRISTLKYSAAA